MNQQHPDGFPESEVGSPEAPLSFECLSGIDRRKPRIRKIPLSKIQLSGQQPRGRLDADELQKLKSSIESVGIIQPPLVRPLSNGRYEVVAGERRFRAAVQLRAEGKIANSIYADVQELSDFTAFVVGFVENMQREDMSCVDEAAGFGIIYERLAAERGRELVTRELEVLLPRKRQYISELIKIHRALKDPDLGPLVRDADKIGKRLLLDILRLKSLRKKRQALQLVAQGGPTEEVAVLLRGPKRRRPPSVVSHKKVGRNGFDLSAHVRDTAAMHELKRAREKLREATEHVERMIEEKGMSQA